MTDRIGGSEFLDVLGADLKFSLDPEYYEYFFDVPEHLQELDRIGVPEQDVRLLSELGELRKYLVHKQDVPRYRRDESRRRKAHARKEWSERGLWTELEAWGRLDSGDST